MSLFGDWEPSAFIADQKKLCADAAATNAALASCTGLDAVTKASWAAWYTSLQSFCVIVPVWFFATGANEQILTGSLMDQLDTWKRENFAWKQKLAAKCAVGVVVDPNASPLSSWLGGAETARTVQYVAAAAAVVAAAYLGGQFVSLVPSARLRARTTRERERTVRHALRRS